MSLNRSAAEARARSLYAEKDRERTIAATLPPGDEQDLHVMRAERLCDEAWSIEEQFDLDPEPSGLWH
ncbi:hypothetical protein [Sphingomonas endophytica]|uniref:hypothetical protein n=1 Tax=Sphingomonas endophytica TaxID=869719 RepID=UPI000A4C18C3|nr:hypothetical protein [Sphingomonas endophytica]